MDLFPTPSGVWTPAQPWAQGWAASWPPSQLQPFCNTAQSGRLLLLPPFFPESRSGILNFERDVGFSLCCCWSVAQLCPALCDPMDCGTRGFLVLHHLLEFAQTHVHWVSDAIQPSLLLSSPSPLGFYLSQHQGIFQGVSCSHQVAEV